MKKYLYIGDDLWPEEPLELKGMTVLSEEQQPQFTGLYDSEGRKIFSYPERFRVGFTK